MEKKIERVHPLFVTKSEGKNDFDNDFKSEGKNDSAKVYSDHLPVLGKIPLTENESLNVITLNTMGDLGGCPLLPYGTNNNDEKNAKRQERIAIGLKRCIDKNSVDVLLIQEGTKDMFSMLKEHLNEDEWEFRSSDENSRQLISVFRKERLTVNADNYDRGHRTYGCNVKDEKTNLVIDITNIWGEYNAFPNYMEKVCTEKLTTPVNSEIRADISFIGGDTNSECPPLDNKPKNVATAVIPDAFVNIALAVDYLDEEQKMLQLSASNDGGFIKNKEGIIHQMEGNILDLSTGEIISTEISAEQAQTPLPHDRVLMAMALDYRYKETAMIEGITRFDYEAKLNAEFGTTDLLVRPAANRLNQKFVAVKLPTDCPDYTAQLRTQISELKLETFKIATELDGTVLVHYIFAPEKDSEKLTYIMSAGLLSLKTIKDHFFIEQAARYLITLDSKEINTFLVNLKASNPENEKWLRGTINNMLEDSLGHTNPRIQGSRYHWNPVKEDSLSSAELKDRYQSLKGDALKTSILVDFKHDTDKLSSIEELNACRDRYKEDGRYGILQTKQGIASKIFNLDADSVKAFDHILKKANERIESKIKQDNGDESTPSPAP